jgi:DHA3 family macrolide efflux protein-like MFS transporter
MARELTAGFKLAADIADVRRILLLAAAMFCSWGAFLVMEPLYVRDTLHRSPAVLGFLQSAFGIGLILATVALPRLGDRVVSVKAVSYSILASGAAAMLYVATHILAVSMAGVFIWGVAVGFFISPTQTLLQRATPPETHGRVMSLTSLVDGLGGLVSIPLSGALVGAVGIARTGAVVGVLLAATGVSGLLVVSRRTYPNRWSKAPAIAE